MRQRRKFGRRTVYLETFGCQMNVLDSQLVQGQLRALGLSVCRGLARRRRGALQQLFGAPTGREQGLQSCRRSGYSQAVPSSVVLAVIGCMAERDGVDMLRRYPQIDVLCGPVSWTSLPLLIDNAVKTTTTRGKIRRPLADPQQGGRVALQGNTVRRSATLVLPRISWNGLIYLEVSLPTTITGRRTCGLPVGATSFVLTVWCRVREDRRCIVHLSTSSTSARNWSMRV